MGTLYMSIKDDLLAKIEDGTYAEGQVIPSEVDLAKAYGVSRPTVRQALRILANDGYLDRRKRRGTVVANPGAGGHRAEDAPSFGEGAGSAGVRSFEDEIATTGRVVRTLPVVVKREVATAEVARGLELEGGGEVFKIVRLRYVDETPNVFMENYVPCEPFPNFIDGVDFSRTRLYGRLRELGHPVKTVRRRIDVMAADSSVAMLLDVSVGDPMFLFHTRGQDAQGNTIEYSVSTYRGNTNSFEFVVADPEVAGSELPHPPQDPPLPGTDAESAAQGLIG